MAAQVECVVRGSEMLGECTIWCDREQALWWVDSRGPSLNRLDPSSGAVRRLALPEVIGSFALRESAGMVAALKSGLYRLDPVGGALDRIAAPEAHLPENRFNDGRCDRAGRFWAGTMSDARREPTGSLYRLEADGRCSRMFGDVVVPNSIAWSPDDRTMYFADTYRNRIRAFDFDLADGTITNERLFVDTSAHPGKPDGSCVDADGCLWNAEYGGWRLVRYAPSGAIDRVIELPVSNPTCCCFGGPQLDTLYLTSARQRLTPEDLERQPLAGSVFALRPGVTGLPEARFAG
jgi:sugar lactone lactonase YvrE